MKSILLTSIVTLTLIFGSCASSKMDQKPPFKVLKTTVDSWFGGVKGASGTTVLIYVDDITTVELQQLFYKNTAVAVQLKKDADGKPIIAGYFNNSKKKSNDLILSGNSKEEYGNSLPNTVKKPPFNLKDNEAVISYKKGDKIFYYKVENLSKSDKPTFYN